MQIKQMLYNNCFHTIKLHSLNGPLENYTCHQNIPCFHELFETLGKYVALVIARFGSDDLRRFFVNPPSPYIGFHSFLANPPPPDC